MPSAPRIAAVLTSSAVLLVAALGVTTMSVPVDPEPIKYTRTTAIGWHIKTTIDNRWYPDSVGIADRIYTGGWGHHAVERGSGTCLTLFRMDHAVETFDGTSHFKLVFQLPPDPVVGTPYTCRPIPADRETVQEDEFTKAARMRPGEFTAFRFGNPMMGWMEDDGTAAATVTILEFGPSGARIHVRVVAELHPRFDFDLDDEFDLKLATVYRTKALRR